MHMMSTSTIASDTKDFLATIQRCECNNSVIPGVSSSALQMSLDNVTPVGVKCMILSYLILRPFKCMSVVNKVWLNASKRPESKINGPEDEIWTMSLYGLFRVTSTSVQKISRLLPLELGISTCINPDSILITGPLDSNLNFTNLVYHYTPSIDKWDILPSMRTKRHGHSSVRLTNPERVLVIGGGGARGGSDGICESYDVVSQQWTSIPSLATDRYHTTSVVFDNKVYVFGGCIYERTNFGGNTHEKTNLCEVYDESKQCWSKIAAMSIARTESCAIVADQVILILGGNTSTGKTDTIEEYRPSTNSWRVLKWKLQHSCSEIVASYNNYTGVLMIGNINKQRGSLKVYLRKEPFESNEWQRCI